VCVCARARALVRTACLRCGLDKERKGERERETTIWTTVTRSNSAAPAANVTSKHIRGIARLAIQQSKT
jgi:hypothetical protein